MKNYIRRVLSLFFVLLVSVTVLAGCGGGNDNDLAKAFTLPAQFQAAAYGANAGSFGLTSAEWGVVKEKTKEIPIKYDYSNLQKGGRFTRAIKISSPYGAKAHLFAVDTIGWDSYLWDIANNLEALGRADYSNSPINETLVSSLKQAGYSGYWGQKAGNVYSGDSAKRSKFYFVADIQGVYTIHIDTIDFETGNVIGSTTKKIKVKGVHEPVVFGAFDEVK